MLAVVGGSAGGGWSADRIAPTATPTDDDSPHSIVWVCEGHHYIGKRLRRFFGRAYTDATVVAWVPEEGDDQALFSIVQ
jgi:hypothetical protein